MINKLDVLELSSVFLLDDIPNALCILCDKKINEENILCITAKRPSIFAVCESCIEVVNRRGCENQVGFCNK